MSGKRTRGNFGFRYRRAKESRGVNSEAGQNIRDRNCSLTYPDTKGQKCLFIS
ncbi:hypothetical protein PUN28_007362 [Cardiocondyla obscurior]|uniref:Uncharacterized protein n=1 Tax=Cardiocondyla obscurior TaxID=286306 RepID=A0AAW2G567_9HYME